MKEKEISPDPKRIRRKLLGWYDGHRRCLPWRETRDPYAIWISEIMLQQTQVKTVVPYYLRFLERFPTVETLARAPLGDVAKVKGVGQTKAIQLKAAFTLARHLRERAHERQPTVTVPADAAELVREEMRLLDRESFRVILLNTKNGFIKTCAVSLGSLNASIVEPREVFKEAISASAAGVILAHNHPSGDPTPSSEDIAITKRLMKAGELLGIAVHDHIILGRRIEGRDSDFVSFKEIGLL